MSHPRVLTAGQSDDRYDVAFVTYRLEEAGMTLLSLPAGRASSHLPSAMPDVVRSAVEAYGWSGMALRPPIPPAAKITRMDEALEWIKLIPLDPAGRNETGPWSVHGGGMLRKIVGARTLVSPVTERHLFSWRRLGDIMNANHESVRQWHRKGVDIVVEELNRRRRVWPVEIRLTD